MKMLRGETSGGRWSGWGSRLEAGSCSGGGRGKEQQQSCFQNELVLVRQCKLFGLDFPDLRSQSLSAVWTFRNLRLLSSGSLPACLAAFRSRELCFFVCVTNIPACSL